MTASPKMTLIGGGGIRTPLLVHGLAQSATALGLSELALFDIDEPRLNLMKALGEQIAKGSGLRLTATLNLPDAVRGARYVLSSIRPGGIAARASDEALALRHGLAGQETTGPGGWAMALRAVPIVLEHARVVEREAPEAWFISFSNPAGLVTQALAKHTSLRTIGICDTPAELFHQIALAAGHSPDAIECDYLGLNHLGWVPRVRANGDDITASILNDESRLRRIYPANLFDPRLIRSLGAIPSEYLFFYYNQHRARTNQQAAGATRGAEVAALNATLTGTLQALVEAGNLGGAVEEYKQYLRRRSGSYMQLEAAGGSAMTSALQQEDPFEAATGYHRIALSVMHALAGEVSKPIVVNTLNRGSIPDFAADDVVEVPCRISPAGVEPLPAGKLPDSVAGLALAVKEYERLTIRAAVERNRDMARLALLVNPIVGEWSTADALATDLASSDPTLAWLSN